MNEIEHEKLESSIKQLLETKHIILYGSNKSKRANIAQKLIKYSNLSESDIYTFREGIESYDIYLESARNIFPIVSPVGVDKFKMSFDAVDDVILDWVEDKTSALIYIPEMHFSLSFPPQRIISDYLTEKYILEEYFGEANKTWFRFIMTTDYELKNVYKILKLYFGRAEDDTQTVAAIAKNHIAVIRVD